MAGGRTQDGSNRKTSAIVVIAAIAALFLLLYGSRYVVVQNSDRFYDMLDAKKAMISMARFKTSTHPVCFTLDSSALASYPFLQDMIRQADSFVQTPIPPSLVNSDRFDMFGNDVSASALIPLIREHEDRFNHTIEYESFRDGKYVDDVHDYTCNIGYENNQYFFGAKFRSLSILNNYSGYVPVNITDNGTVVSDQLTGKVIVVEQPGHLDNTTFPVVYQQFNNTVVWTNSLHYPVILNITYGDIAGNLHSLKTKIYPGKSWDYFFTNYRSLSPVTYHYTVDDSNGYSIQGGITVKNQNNCISQQEAKSLYLQSRFDMKFPSYLPQGYKYLCSIIDDGFRLIQLYTNNSSYFHYSASDIEQNLYPFSYLANDTLRVIANKGALYQHPLANYTAEYAYEQEKRESTQIKLVKIADNVTGVLYTRSWEPDVNHLFINQKGTDEYYMVDGRVSFEELARVGSTLPAMSSVSQSAIAQISATSFANSANKASAITNDTKALKAHDILSQMLVNHDTKGIPIFAVWLEANSTVMVGISDTATGKLANYKTMIQNIVGTDVPLQLGFGHITPTSCSSQTSDCTATAMTGGIKVTYNPYSSTMTYPTSDTSGHHGFVMVGHSTGWGVTGVSIAQATSRVVGTVITNPSGGSSHTRSCECIFVQYNSGYGGDENTIYRTSGTETTIIGKTTSANQPFNGACSMMGVTSGYL
jgi:hypothetical protein